MEASILVSDQPLSLDDCFSAVRDPACGGLAFFVGTIRNHNKGEEVVRLEFDAYGPMAEREMNRICTAAAATHGLKKVALHHRRGALEIGDIAVIVAVASHHRAAAFAGCAEIIDELKQHVPIWKKEFLADGGYWVGARP